MAASFAQAFESGSAGSIAFRVRNLAGELRWVESTLTPFPAEDGERHVLVVSRDVTEGRRMERQLRESRERFQLIAENAYDMIVEYDSQWRMQYANDRVREVLGLGDASSIRSIRSATSIPMIGPALRRVRAACAAARGVRSCHLSRAPRRRHPGAGSTAAAGLRGG